MRHNRIAITVEYGCVSLRMRFFPQNFGTIKRILPGSSSPSHREGPGTEVVVRVAMKLSTTSYPGLLGDCVATQPPRSPGNEVELSMDSLHMTSHEVSGITILNSINFYIILKY